MSGSNGKSLAMLPWWPGAFMSSTRGWSVTAKGVYRELLDAQWDMGTLPADPAELQRVIGATAEEWSQGWPRCAAKFPAVSGGLQNPRLEEHRADSLRRRGRKQEGARKTNEVRRAKRDANRNAERTLSEAPSGTPTPTPTPISTATSSESGDSFGIARPLARTTTPRLAHEAPEFHQQVVAVYHEVLPDLPSVREWGSRRRSKLNARIRERLKAGKPADTVGYWRDLFAERVMPSDFLMGRATNWRLPGLEWLLESQNFEKLLEGTYANVSRGNGGTHVR